jgi:hypothetical protein
MLQNSPKRICDFKIFFRGYTGTPIKKGTEGEGGKEGEERGRELGRRRKGRKGGEGKEGGREEMGGREGKFRTPTFRSKVTPFHDYRINCI